MARLSAGCGPRFASHRFNTALTIILLIAYFLSGMNAFDSFNHSLTTISTGGFSTRAGSLAEFGSWTIESVAAAGMLLGAIGIGVYARIWRRQWRRVARDQELQLLVILVLAAALTASGRHFLGDPFAAAENRTALLAATFWSETFAAISALTTAGFPSAFAGTGADWSGLGPVPALLLGLAIAGGSAASTAGGVRLMSVSLLIRHSFDEFGRIGRPRYVRGQSQIRDAAGAVADRLDRIDAVRSGRRCGYIGDLHARAGLRSEPVSDRHESDKRRSSSCHFESGDPDAWRSIPPEGRVLCCVYMALGRVGVVSVVAMLFFD